MNFSTVVVAVDMDDKTIQTLSQIKSLALPKESQIHLVHIFELNFFSFDFLPAMQPSPEDYLMIQKLMEEKLMKVKDKLGFEGYNNIVVKCLISGNAKQEFLEYADEVNASLIVAASKERKGLSGFFESSFTSFLNSFARADLVILRPKALS